MKINFFFNLTKNNERMIIFGCKMKNSRIENCSLILENQKNVYLLKPNCIKREKPCKYKKKKRKNVLKILQPNLDIQLKNNPEFLFEKLDESIHYVYLSVQIFNNFRNETYFLKYKELKIEYTNNLCKLAGFENYFSLIFMHKLKNNPKKLLYIDLFLSENIL